MPRLPAEQRHGRGPRLRTSASPPAHHLLPPLTFYTHPPPAPHLPQPAPLQRGRHHEVPARPAARVLRDRGLVRAVRRDGRRRDHQRGAPQGRGRDPVRARCEWKVRGHGGEEHTAETVSSGVSSGVLFGMCVGEGVLTWELTFVGRRWSRRRRASACRWH